MGRGRIEVRFAGFGGQGIILASYIIGKAAALYDDKKSVQTQSYGPEARGGACSSGVIISDINIDYPYVHDSDILMVMSQEAYTVFIKKCRDGSTVFLDEDLVELREEHSGLHFFSIPATRLAEEMGKRVVANIVMLGFFSGLSGIIRKSSMEKSIESSVPPPTKQLNIEAFNRGFEYAGKYLTDKGEFPVK